MIERYRDENRASLFSWCEIKIGSKILYIHNREDAYIQPYTLKNEVTCESIKIIHDKQWIQSHTGYFDYIISVTDLEKAEQPEDVIRIWKQLLNENGKLFLALNNRLGLRYFCGDRDSYTGRNYDGIEDYKNFYRQKQDTFMGKMYDQSTIKKMLIRSGWEERQFRFYSVLSDLNNPVLIYSEKYLPIEDLSSRVFPTYNYPDSIFLEEENIYEGLIANNMFHQMANSYLIECSISEDFLDVLSVTNSVERGKKDALLTIIRESGSVEKLALYPEGTQRLEELSRNLLELKNYGIPVVEGKLEGNAYSMPYIEAPVAHLYLNELAEKDTLSFLQKLDKFRDMILRSSPIVQDDNGDGNGVILERGYLDMIPLNSFYVENQFVFFDQEFCMENCPANVTVYRMIGSLYSANSKLEKYVSKQELYKRYHLAEKLGKWEGMAKDFIYKLRKINEHASYHVSCQRDNEIVMNNRKRMNYSEQEYKRLFEDILVDVDKKRLILFGSGIYAHKFMAMYGRDYDVAYSVDNNPDNWGKKLGGIEVVSPKVLTEIHKEEYKVIICMKNYLRVLKQLDEMDGLDYGVFDPGKCYVKSKEQPVHHKTLETATDKVEKKKYKTGYVAGVFDMFHVGHLNLLRKAKEQCEYLIVGVVPDEDVLREKKKYPIISCEDRVEIVSACKYVDRAEPLSIGCGNIRNAYRMYQFDVMFSGNDHGVDAAWLAEKNFLNKNGVDIVFIPYTEKVSSTQLRDQITQK